MNYKTDIAIIGGGAAGLVCAIRAKRKNPSLEVTVIEGLDRVGKKLIITGNGRCNISNSELILNRFHGEDAEFCLPVFKRFGYTAIKEFFACLGVDFVTEFTKAYPASLQASSVVDALRFECERLGIKTVLNSKIKQIKADGVFTLASENNIFTAKAVVVAAGLFSGGEKIGSDGSIFRLLKNMGVSAIKATPSLVQLKTETEWVRQLKGIKVDALASLLCEGKKLAEYCDEVLFCDYGLSGPAILQISRESARDDRKYEVSLDLYPSKTETMLTEYLIKRIKLLGTRNLEDFFTGALNKRVGQIILKYCGFRLSDSVSLLTDKDAADIARALKNFRFKVTSNTGFVNSQVTAGGLSTKEFDQHTMMCKKIRGLFAAGEILDIDGDCGGFNLSWAFASGLAAAEGAVDYLC